MTMKNNEWWGDKDSGYFLECHKIVTNQTRFPMVITNCQGPWQSTANHVKRSSDR